VLFRGFDLVEVRSFRGLQLFVAAETIVDGGECIGSGTGHRFDGSFSASPSKLFCSDMGDSKSSMVLQNAAMSEASFSSTT
jgi:hypothetical protein